MVCTQEESVLYVYTKFEVDSSIHLKVIRGPKISKFGHVTQAMPNQGCFLVRTQEGVRLLSVPNLKQRALFFQKL